MSSQGFLKAVFWQCLRFRVELENVKQCVAVQDLARLQTPNLFFFSLLLSFKLVFSL